MYVRTLLDMNIYAVSSRWCLNFLSWVSSHEYDPHSHHLSLFNDLFSHLNLIFRCFSLIHCNSAGVTSHPSFPPSASFDFNIHVRSVFTQIGIPEVRSFTCDSSVSPLWPAETKIRTWWQRCRASCWMLPCCWTGKNRKWRATTAL